MKFNGKKNYFALFALAIFLCGLFLGGCGSPSDPAGPGSTQDVPATFESVIADGSSSVTTTKLTLSFNKDIAGLESSDITLTAENTGAVKGALSKTGTGKYELAVNSLETGGLITVSVSKSGYNISGNPQYVTVYFYSSSDTLVNFENVTADGSSTVTTKLILDFDTDITDLTADDIVLIVGNTGAVKGELSRTGTGKYELAVSSITSGGLITVSVSKIGYNISGNPQYVTVYLYSASDIHVNFESVTADGSLTATTTKVTLNFDIDITGLTANDITLTAGNTGAVKGALSRTETGKYELAISGSNAGGIIVVSVNKAGYAIVPPSKTVLIYCTNSTTFPIIFEDLEKGPVIDDVIIDYLGQYNVRFSLANPQRYESIEWDLDGRGVIGTGSPFTLDPGDEFFERKNAHFMTVLVIMGGVPYSAGVTVYSYNY